MGSLETPSPLFVCKVLKTDTLVPDLDAQSLDSKGNCAEHGMRLKTRLKTERGGPLGRVLDSLVRLRRV